MAKPNKILVFYASLFLFSCGAVFAETGKYFLGEITSDQVNLRVNSTVNSEVIQKMNKGEQISVVSELYGWFKVKTPKTAPSFIKKNLLALINEKTGRVSGNSVNVRLSPGESSAIIGKAYRDEIVAILGEENGWCRIEPVDNSFGWIHKKFVKEAVIKPPPVVIEPLPPKETPVLNPLIKDDSIVVEGILNSYGKVFFRKATHKLICPEGKIFLIKASKQTLNPLTYHKVRISGKLNKDSANGQKYPLIELDKIEALD